MLKYCVNKWDAGKNNLEAALRELEKENPYFEYKDLMKLIVKCILNAKLEKTYDHNTWDVEHITQIDDGDYQGTLLFLIPTTNYQPFENNYLMTYIGYGSCSGCDTLLAAQDGIDIETRIKDYMSICLHLIQNMIHPYPSYDEDGLDEIEGE